MAEEKSEPSHSQLHMREPAPSSHVGCESRVVSSRNSTWLEHCQAKVTFPGADEGCALADEKSPWG
jgi:hypothetical protein